MADHGSRASTAKRSLVELAKARWQAEGRRLVVPFVGYPGLRLTRSSVKQNQFNHAMQYQTIARLYEHFHPHAMLFLMDLSVEASALGLPVRFPVDKTPSIEGHPVRSSSDLENFRRIDVLADGRVMVYLEVMRHMRAALPVPVGGYVTGPFTLAGMLMDASELAMALLVQPELARETLEFSFGVVMRYASALVDAGADFLVILDPTAVMLGPEQYAAFAGVYIREIVGLLDAVEIYLHVCGDTTHLLHAMADTGVAGISLDSAVDMVAAAKQLGPDVLLWGNVDPVAMLRRSPEEIFGTTQTLLGEMAFHPLHILGTGCDLPLETPLENIHAFMDAGRQWSRGSAATVAASSRE